MLGGANVNKKQVILFLHLLKSIVFEESFEQERCVFTNNNELFTATFFKEGTLEDSIDGQNLRRNFFEKVILENEYSYDQTPEDIKESYKESFRKDKVTAFEETKNFVLNYKPEISLELPLISNIRFLSNYSLPFEFYNFGEDATFELVGLLAKPETEA